MSAGDRPAGNQAVEDRRACIVGLQGENLSGDEARYLAAHRPCGIIIFTRNYSSNGQLRRLIDDARSAAGLDEWLVLVDQEGGRVQRLRGAPWPDFPPAAAFGAFYEAELEEGLAAAELASQWLSVLLRDVGINTNCTPCLDVPVAGAHGIIGDRAYSNQAETVGVLGAAVARGMMAGGVVPVVKHIPGHGRAGVDSHLALPVVDTGAEELAAQDFAPFAANATLPAAMSAHVTYTAIDGSAPASTSKRLINDVVREQIGFDGLLMSDDVSMQALAGSIGERARAVADAGSDVILHCNGVMTEMQEVAEAAPMLAGDALARYNRCLDIARQAPCAVDPQVARVAIDKVWLALQESRDAAEALSG